MDALWTLVGTLCLTSHLTAWAANTLPPPCDSEIYCHGELLKVVQLARLEEDSKTFVDLKQKFDPKETLQHFWDMMNATKGSPSLDDIAHFVNTTFEKGSELQEWIPSDWTETPKILNRIADPGYRQWARDLNNLWKTLSRRMSDDVRDNPSRYSIIYVPNGFVIPGGRFREFYYWDTYWIVRGLLLCDMHTTVRGILLNFLSLVQRYGLIPNGGRVYYLGRSQPPMLTPMIAQYVRHTRDLEFVKDHMHIMEKEFDFWMTQRVVSVEKNGKKYLLARYYAPSYGPRPESYVQDWETAGMHNGNIRRDPDEVYISLKSAAESGWDFSSRWFIKNGTNGGNLSDIHTEYILPVDLNALIFLNAKLLTTFSRYLGDQKKAKYYYGLSEQWLDAVTNIMWDEKEGTWFDYDFLNNKSRSYFYPSNLAPLWTGCYDQSWGADKFEKMVRYVNKSGILDFHGGIPMSVVQSGEQWDFPNAWPPLQGIVIQGLQNTGNKEAKRMAYTLTENWIRANYKGYSDYGEMFEKYDAVTPGRFGGGGEYTVQAGFGWTNGVVLELLDQYGSRLRSPSQEKTKGGRTRRQSDTEPRRHHG